MGTLSKAIGSIGGFVAGSHTLVDFLRNRARSFIYTTALPPAACAAAIAAIQIMEDGSPLPKLISNTAHLRAGIKELNLNMLDSETQIIPIFIGDLERTMEVSSKLSERGIFISGIRPPTVLKNKCRLRITATADHSKEELECLVSLLRELIPA
jgi:7-keto-8-aminopelargonate synthetase-like enzyme